MYVWVAVSIRNIPGHSGNRQKTVNLPKQTQDTGVIVAGSVGHNHTQ